MKPPASLRVSQVLATIGKITSHHTLEKIDFYQRHRTAFSVIMALLINALYLVALDKTFRTTAEFAQQSPVELIPIILVASPGAQRQMPDTAEETSPRSSSEQSERARGSSQPPPGNLVVSAVPVELPTVEESSANFGIDVWSGYCETGPDRRDAELDCPRAIPTIPYTAELGIWRDAVEAVKTARENGIASSSPAELLWPKLAARQKDERILRDLTDFRRRGVERMMDPVPSLTGRTSLPDPTWTLSADPVFDLKKLDKLERALNASNEELSSVSSPR